MRRSRYLAALTAIGVVLTGAAYRAQDERAALAVQQITDNLYVLGNAPSVQGMGGGGNTAIFITTDGVALVDTKINGYGQDIIAHVGALTDKPITHVINTHTHFDHSGGNIELPDTVNFVVHENTLAQMSRDTCQPVTNCDAFKGENAGYLPKTAYSERMSLFNGADRIDLYHFGRGHTDGDTFVVFRDARTMHTGDMFQRKGLPFIDVANGNGSATEFGETLKKAVAGVSGVDTVIPGAQPDAGDVERVRRLQRVLQRRREQGAAREGGGAVGRRGGRRLQRAGPVQRLRGAGGQPPDDRAARLRRELSRRGGAHTAELSGRRGHDVHERTPRPRDRDGGAGRLRRGRPDERRSVRRAPSRPPKASSGSVPSSSRRCRTSGARPRA